MIKQKKWQDFKERRLKVIDGFIAAKKKQLRSRRLRILINVNAFIRQVSFQFEELKHIYEQHKKGLWLHIMISAIWIKRRKKFGKNLDAVIQRDIKKRLTLVGSLTKESMEQRSFKILKPILFQLSDIFKIK